ncbi:MAG: FtsX-like permease family protein [Candidatus Heimdallarchaeota archaeon]|nr:FtsX-like permease family protein [Candidatus Heimdallarchaeota archaeon]
MTRTRFLSLKKVYRDIFRHKSRTFPILLLIVFGTAFGIAFLQMGVNLKLTNDSINESMEMGDIWFGTRPFDNSVFNATLIDKWNQTGFIEAVQARIFITGYVLLPDDVKIPVDIISLPNSTRAAVNDIIIPENTYFTNFPEIKDGAYVSEPYLPQFGWKQDQTLQIQTTSDGNLKNFTLTILGGQFSAEYPFRKSDYSKLNLISDLIIKLNIYVREDYLQQELFNGLPVYNQIVLKLKDSNKIQSIVEEVSASRFSKEYIFTVSEFPRFLKDMPTMIELIGSVFAGFILLLASFSIYLTVNRFIEEEKPQIGVLKGLGYGNEYVLRQYLLYGVFFAIIGIIPGIILGYILDLVIVLMISEIMFSWPFTVQIVTLEFILIMLISVSITTTLACFLSARTAVKISPQAAIRPNISLTLSSKSKIERILELISRKRLLPEIKYFLRVVFQKPKKTIFSLTALSSAVALFVMMTSFVVAINSGTDAVLEAELWDLNFELSRPVSFQNVKNNLMSNVTLTDFDIEPAFTDFAKIKVEKDLEIWTNIIFYGIRTNTSMKDFERNLFSQNNSLIISPDIAKIFNIEEGESYSLIGRNNTEVTIVVQTILTKNSLSGFFVPLELAMILSFGDLSLEQANILLVASDNPAALSEVKDILEEEDYVQNVITVDSLVASIRSFIDIMIIGFLLFEFGAALMAAIIIFGIMSIATAERKNDFAVMKALGINNKRIYQISFTETSVLTIIAGVVGFILGILLAITLTEWIKNILSTTMAPISTSIVDFIIALIFASVTLYLGQFMALRIALKQSISEVTKDKLFA